FHESNERLRQPAQRRIDYVLRGLAMTGQVKGIDRRLLRQRVDVEQPIVEIAAEAMDQDNGCFPFAPSGEAHPAERQIGKQVPRPGLLFLGRGGGGGVASDESIDLGIGHLVVRQYPEKRLYRIDRAGFSDDPAQRARVPGLDDASDLLGLDVEKLV